MESITTFQQPPEDTLLDDIAAAQQVVVVGGVTQETVAPTKEEEEASVVVVPVPTISVLTQLSHTLSSLRHDDNAMTILQQYRVPLHDDDLLVTLECLDRLQQALEMTEPPMPTANSPSFNNNNNNRTAPGFLTTTTTNHHQQLPFNGTSGAATDESGNWVPIRDMPCYEGQVYSHNAAQSVPSITKQFALDCCQKILPILDERQAFLKAPTATAATAFCECVTQWQHFNTTTTSVASVLVNQALEQFMVREASDYCDQHVNVQEWDAQYAPEHCPVPSLDAVTEPSSIRILRNRDMYLETLVNYALAARTKIQIATCYIFYHDPVQRYIFLDLLPYCAKQHGVQVQILLDMTVVESLLFQKSGFYDAMISSDSTTSTTTTTPNDNNNPTTTNDNNDHDVKKVTDWSFEKVLPDHAPPPVNAKRALGSTLTFLEEIHRVAAALSEEHASSSSLFQVRWWCARDAKARYRIKNHCKGVVLDDEIAIFGGSNVAPTVAAAESELDLLVMGPVAQQVSASLSSLWNAMAPTADHHNNNNSNNNHVVASPSLSLSSQVASNDDPIPTNSNSRLYQVAAEEQWDDSAARVALVRSFPSSKGDDIIYRMILGTLQIAKKRIIITMGHSNYPRSLADALAVATNRGVQVQVLANSKFSCDILVNQRDLMLSCRDLLRVAPKVELYLTCWEPGNDRPPFVHAKYVTMDGLWSAVGSWNVWTRGSFYELEHEAMIESKAIAQALEDKFEVDKASTVRVNTAEELEPGRGWCPSGCGACRGFGPFYKP